MSIANRLSAFGESVFATWSRIAIGNDAINLGQGFPDFPAPDFIKEAAIKAIRDNENQYSRSAGHPKLVEAIAQTFQVETNPMDEVTVTCGSTETIAATILGLVNEGDEVIVVRHSFPQIGMRSHSGNECLLLFWCRRLILQAAFA